MKINRRFHVRAIVGIVLVGMLSMAAVAGDTSRPIRVVNPDKLPVELPADRTAMGTAYKPSIVGDRRVELGERWGNHLSVVETDYARICW